MKDTKYHTIPSFTIKPENESMFSERVTRVSIQDEGGGCFIVVTQEPDYGGEQEVRIDIEEWPNIREAINKLVPFCEAENCKTYDN